MEEHEATRSRSNPSLSADRLAEALAQTLLDIEQERSALIRHLHDEFGGLLVGALMDLSWVSQQASETSAAHQKLARATNLLREAIDLKRELIETLKPTLLENIGLFCALRWYLKNQCGAAAVAYSESYPDEEVSLDAKVKIGVFRILEEALRHELSDGTLSTLTLEVKMVGDTLNCHLEGEHLTSQIGPAAAANLARVTGMQFRAGAMGGTFGVEQMPDGRHFDLRIPILRV